MEWRDSVWVSVHILLLSISKPLMCPGEFKPTRCRYQCFNITYVLSATPKGRHRGSTGETVWLGSYFITVKYQSSLTARGRCLLNAWIDRWFMQKQRLLITSSWHSLNRPSQVDNWSMTLSLNVKNVRPKVDNHGSTVIYESYFNKKVYLQSTASTLETVKTM